MTPATLAADADLMRLRGEFLALPGLRLTAHQAARLLGIGLEEAAGMLAMLADEGFLIGATGAAYRRSMPALA